MMAKRKVPPRRKRSKRKPREFAPERSNPFLEYGNSWPRSLAHEIRAEIDDGNSDLEEMVKAIHFVDQYHLTNPRPNIRHLISLLDSRGTSAAENKLLSNLFDRIVIKWPVGARRRPAYLISDDNNAVLNGCADVRDLLAANPKMSVTDAVARVAKKSNIAFNKLLDAYQKRSRLTRKKKQ